VGVPRSGTSLLHVLLNQHPLIALMFEADLPLLWPLFLKRRSKTRWLERWNLWNRGVERHQIDLSKIPDDASDVRTATEAVYGEYARHKSALIWGDKTPDQYDSLVRLAKYFPNARFIIIWRDPADVSRSMIRARKGSMRFKQRGLTHRALLGCQELGRQRDRLRKGGIPVHELQYQNMIHNPVEEMQKICSFLGIAFHPSMATLQNADRTAIHRLEHNALVNGEKIVVGKKYEEVLPLKLGKKIARYKNLWRARHFDWAMWPESAEIDPSTPSMLERLIDRLRYRLLKTWDLGIVVAYCFIPLKLLTTYRSWKGHPYLNSTWQEYVRAYTKPERSSGSDSNRPSSLRNATE
jgi:hypothetical protein